jgi:hypothetical protein
MKQAIQRIVEEKVPWTKLANSCAIERNRIEMRREMMRQRIAENLKENYHLGI